MGWDWMVGVHMPRRPVAASLHRGSGAARCKGLPKGHWWKAYVRAGRPAGKGGGATNWGAHGLLEHKSVLPLQGEMVGLVLGASHKWSGGHAQGTGRYCTTPTDGLQHAEHEHKAWMHMQRGWKESREGEASREAGAVLPCTFSRKRKRRENCH